MKRAQYFERQKNSTLLYFQSRLDQGDTWFAVYAFHDATPEVLRALEDDGLVESRESTSIKQKRTQYSLTFEGQTAAKALQTV